VKDLLETNEALYKKVQVLAEDRRTLLSALKDLRPHGGCFCSDVASLSNPLDHTRACIIATKALEKIK